MKKRKLINNISFSALFLALSFIFPFLTGQIPQIGSMLCPMHIPVLLCGYICGGTWGFAVGLIAPVMRSFVLGMPPMFPTSVAMAFELATYGLVIGFIRKVLTTKKWSIYVSLFIAMIAGRLVWGLVMFVLMGFDKSVFGINAFLAGAFINAVPGIIVQIILIPAIIMVIPKHVIDNNY